MDTKKQSTLSRAFSRFGRKSASQSNPAATVASEPIPEPAPEPTVASGKHVIIDAHPTNMTTENAAAPVYETKPLGGHVHSNEGNDSANDISFSNDIQPLNTTKISPLVHFVGDNRHHHHHHHNNTVSPPGSPHISAMHPRYSTSTSSLSTTSRHALSGSEDNTEGGLNPADILLSRLTTYRVVVKNLQQYFKEIASVENVIAKAMHKASNMIVVPFKDGGQFLSKGGLQDVCIGVRDSTRIRSEQHANAARFVEETSVKNIRRLKQDIKGRIKALKSDSNLYETRVFEERETTQELIGNLAKAIGLFENAGGHQPDMEKWQEQVMMFEKHIINEIKQVLNSFAQYQHGHASAGFIQSWAPAERALNVLQEDSEWNNFLERNGHRLFPSDLVDSNPEELDYPCKNCPFVVPVKTAHLSRQSSVLKHWKEGFFVITLSGWLHIFASADLMKDSVPERSIYIPTATLGPYTEDGQKQHVFSLEGKGMGGIMHREAQTLTIRATSREEMLEWWTEISKRAHSTISVQPGDGQLDSSLSRSGSVARSSSLMRSGSKATRPQTPASQHGDFGHPQDKSGAEDVPVALAQTAAPADISTTTNDGTGTSHVNESNHPAAANQASTEVPLAEKPDHQPVSQPPQLQRIDTGSTVSLNTGQLPVLPVQ
ncbi:hypothetical protein BGX27_003726 [Mortierella sp. AM989]|nr:hypothetical protein BGX27_003726 [Mortierella sp. AM989]